MIWHDHERMKKEPLLVSDKACFDHDLPRRFGQDPAVGRGECDEERGAGSLVMWKFAAIFREGRLRQPDSRGRPSYILANQRFDIIFRRFTVHPHLTPRSPV